MPRIQPASSSDPPTPDQVIEALPRPLRSAASLLLPTQADRKRYAVSQMQAEDSGLHDIKFAQRLEDCRPDRVFDQLRWGGQLALVTPRPREAEQTLSFFRDRPEWFIEIETQPMQRQGWGRWLPRPSFLAVVRKVLLDPPSRLTARHSYDVRLTHSPEIGEKANATGHWVVSKKVPTLEQAIARLTQTAPQLGTQRIETLARKMVRRVFPLFLTREAAFLKLLQRDLPEADRHRTPRLLNMQTGEDGLVRSITLSWLRLGGEAISQRSFAKQTARLIDLLHRHAGILHLDLRLDNLVLTDRGVGLVDFGTAVRIGEDLGANPVVRKLHREMIASSETVTRLQRQQAKGLVTASQFANCHQPPTPALDLYALLTNMTQPHDNPDFRGLVRFDPESDQARALSRLRRRAVRQDDQQATPNYDEARPIREVRDLCVELGVPVEPTPRVRREDAEPVVLPGVSMPPPRVAERPLDPQPSEDAKSI
jgi:hypothetical protein